MRVQTLSEIVPDPVQREAILLALGNRFDPTAATQTGTIGEEFVVSECRSLLRSAGYEDLACKVQRVSLISDQLGYDVVAPTISGGSRRMEVKTTSRGGEVVEVIITRNEVRVGLRDPSWALVVCRVIPDGSVHPVGWCRGSVLRPLLPTDVHPHGHWLAVGITLTSDLLSDGLPPHA